MRRRSRTERSSSTRTASHGPKGLGSTQRGPANRGLSAARAASDESDHNDRAPPQGGLTESSGTVGRPVCGIAGCSFSLESTVDRTVATRALLAGIAERGADSVGLAYRGDASKVTVHKQCTGASEFLDRIEVPQTATQLLVHARAY